MYLACVAALILIACPVAATAVARCTNLGQSSFPFVGTATSDNGTVILSGHARHSSLMQISDFTYKS